MKTVILGLGNPILHDDAAGLETIRLIAEKLDDTSFSSDDVDLRMASVGGIRILDQLVGYDRAIVVDALMTGAPPGNVQKLNVDDLTGDLHASCIHDLSFKEAMLLGRTLGMHLPDEITIYGIEVADPYTLSEGCSELVLQGARRAADWIFHNLVEDQVLTERAG